MIMLLHCLQETGHLLLLVIMTAHVPLPLWIETHLHISEEV